MINSATCKYEQPSCRIARHVELSLEITKNISMRKDAIGIFGAQIGKGNIGVGTFPVKLVCTFTNI